MKYYLIGSADGFNELRFPNVENWQKWMGIEMPIKSIWEPTVLEYIYGLKSKRSKNFDFSQTCNPLITVSPKAIDVFKNMFSENGEILDIQYPDGFSFFHCTNIVNALDEEKSEIVWLDKEKGWISGINHFVLKQEKLKGHNIFRLPNANFEYIFFSENFKELYLKNNLKGIHFERFEKITYI